MKKVLFILIPLLFLFMSGFSQQQKQYVSYNDTTVFVIVDKFPEYPGGVEGFYKFLKDNLKYPDEAKRNDINGKVFIKFTIEKDGCVGDVQTLKGIGGGCDEEAVRVIKEMPQWKPGYIKGKPVRISLVIPILFKFYPTKEM